MKSNEPLLRYSDIEPIINDILTLIASTNTFDTGLSLLTSIITLVEEYEQPETNNPSPHICEFKPTRPERKEYNPDLKESIANDEFVPYNSLCYSEIGVCECGKEKAIQSHNHSWDDGSIGWYTCIECNAVSEKQ